MESLQHRVGDTTKAPSTSVGIHASSPVEGETNVTFWLHGAESTAENNFFLMPSSRPTLGFDIAVGVVRTIATPRHRDAITEITEHLMGSDGAGPQSTPMNHENKVET